MKEQERIIKTIIESLETIDFIKKYSSVFIKHNDFDNMMTKMNKSENLKTLRSLGYPFKIFSPGQYYNIEETFSNIRFDLNFKINRGFITSYIYLYINNEKVPFKHSNFTFIYRFLLNDMDAKTTAPKFKDLEELKDIIAALLNIYVDFRDDFLFRMRKNQLIDAGEE